MAEIPKRASLSYGISAAWLSAVAIAAAVTVTFEFYLVLEEVLRAEPSIFSLSVSQLPTLALIFIFGMGITFCLALPLTLVLGVPMHLSFQRFGLTREWHYIAGATSIGILIIILTGSPWSFLGSPVPNLLEYSTAIIPGVAGGSTFWRMTSGPERLAVLQWTDRFAVVALVLAVGAYTYLVNTKGLDADPSLTLHDEFGTTVLPLYMVVTAILAGLILATRKLAWKPMRGLLLSAVVLTPILGLADYWRQEPGLIREFDGHRAVISPKLDPQGGFGMKSIEFSLEDPSLGGVRLNSLAYSSRLVVRVDPRPIEIDRWGFYWAKLNLKSKENGLQCSSPTKPRDYEGEARAILCFDLGAGDTVNAFLRCWTNVCTHIFRSGKYQYEIVYTDDNIDRWHAIEDSVVRYASRILERNLEADRTLRAPSP